MIQFNCYALRLKKIIGLVDLAARYLFYVSNIGSLRLPMLMILCHTILLSACNVTNPNQKQVHHDIFENKVPILGILKTVNSRSPQVAETMFLSLKVRSGNGQVFVSLNSITKIDTQVGLRLAHQDTCLSLVLNCHLYDFYYHFELGDRSVIGGQSGSAAGAFLLVKSLRKEHINPSIAIIGRLTPGIIVAVADGIETKLKHAQAMGFSTVYIPANARCKMCKAMCNNEQACSLHTSSAENSAQMQVRKVISLQEILDPNLLQNNQLVSATEALNKKPTFNLEMLSTLNFSSVANLLAMIDSKKLTGLCQQINQRIQLTALTFSGFRKGHFAKRITANNLLSQGNEKPALCVYEGIRLEAEIVVTMNYLDIPNKAGKLAHLKRFLSIVRTRSQRNANTASYHPALAIVYYKQAIQELEQNNMQSSYLLANIALGYTGVYQFIEL
ncbi:MAG: hypothetical protein ACI9MS_002267 [Glaciecola sp.]